MESIVAAYASSSSDDAASASESEVESSALEGSSGEDSVHVGAKRKRLQEPQWQRAFPHVDGNWPSHVRIDISVTPDLRDLAKDVIERAQELVGDIVTLVPFAELGLGESLTSENSDGLHVSLSRPFVLTHDQIDGFVDALRAALKWRQWYVDVEFFRAMRGALKPTSC